MPAQVIFSPRAENRIEAELIYLRERSPAAAHLLLQRLAAARRRIANFPQNAPRGAAPGTRRLILAPYILTYRERGNLVEILDFHHSRQRQRPLPEER